MSRVSQRSGLSPSATRGASGIDLGKDSGVNMGRNARPSATSGGIGVTQEVANIGGVSVTGGVSIDISPLAIDVRGETSTEDPNKNSISISGSAELPGGLLGLGGGVKINTNTGEIIEGSIGAEIGGLGINVSSSEGDVGVEFTLQIPFTPIEISLGFGFPKKQEPTPTTTPTPTTAIPVPVEQPATKHTPPSVNIESVRGCTLKFTWTETYRDINPYSVSCATFLSGQSYFPYGSFPPSSVKLIERTCSEELRNSPGLWGMQTTDIVVKYECSLNWVIESWGSQTYLNQVLDYVYAYYIRSSYCDWIRDGQVVEIGGGYPIINQRLISEPTITTFNCSTPKNPIVYLPPSTITPVPTFAPFPNPPPRKRNMDECCRDSLKLLRQIRRFEQETMLLLGRPLNAEGELIPLPANAKYFGEEIERIKTPIEDISKAEKEKIKFKNFYELQMYLLKQQINLDVGIDPQSFVAPSGFIQNPAYQRDSELSLESNIQPETDKNGNDRELEIGEDIYINSLSGQQDYIFQAMRRLEYLFPSGELADAKFAKNLIIPGAAGETKIHNLIHFQEFFAQYLNATLGDPKIPIKIEDNNELKEGKQEAIFRHFSIAQMIRELYRITLESGDDINSIMETGVRDFRTNLANRIQIVQIAEMTQALVEDTGMLESQEFIPVKLDGDPYAGKWKAGMGFEPDSDLDSNEEKATEKLMRATLKNFEAQVKVIRRDKRENADIRDLFIQIAEMFIRSTSIPATKEGIEKALAAAKFKTQVDMALTRSQVKRAAAASRSRTKKRKK